MMISLTGFMGCGKSSVGKVLSELLCCRFVDLDEVIVEREGRSIPEIFAEDGEKEFRRLEKETLKDILETEGRGLEIPKTPALVTLPARCKGPLDHLLVRSRPLAGGGMSSPSSSTPAAKSQQDFLPKTDPTLILALGGGAVMTPECEEMVHSGTLCIYLRASVETLVERLTGEAAGRPLLSGTESGRSSKPSVLSGGPSVMSSNPIVMSSEAGTSALRSRILELMALRSETYERVAHLIIDTDGKSIGEIAEEIIANM